jgi:glycosyltransferase involved in cell wall biosynthesis
MGYKIALITTSNLSKVQGSTEAKYVADFLVSEYNTHIYSTANPEIPDARYHSIPHASVIPALILYNFLLLPYFLYQNYKHDYDVIYTYNGFNLTPFCVAALSDCSWIADFQTKPTGQSKEWRKFSGDYNLLALTYYNLFDTLYEFTLSNADAIITLSTPIKDDLVTSYGVPEGDISIVPLGVDSGRFTPNDLQQIPIEPFDIVYLGSIASQRNLGLCINAIASERLEVDVRLHIVGDGPNAELAKLRQIANEAAVEEAVCWHGYIAHEKIPTVLANMDIAISPLPAHDSYEVSSPAKLYEYLSMGLPIICTDLQAHRNVLIEDQTGFFFEPGSLPSLIDVINRISELEFEVWLDIQQHAREAGKDNDWSSRMELIQKIIEKETRNY